MNADNDAADVDRDGNTPTASHVERAIELDASRRDMGSNSFDIQPSTPVHCGRGVADDAVTNTMKTFELTAFRGLQGTKQLA
ncbi:hypothetical protein EVAR_34430_1 [Eumeta japonica]|uniref:Uncharacterized protein n=1 Tax=Eumeta variegata TaxID=151549 RepID=A0A4C1WN44_EUMVA|nr:hypothetical protein EVAR_34430_1 [Eumeta japonica]